MFHNKRKYHIMQPYKTPEYATNLLFFDTETKSKPVKGHPGAERAEFWFGHVLAYRREGDKRTRIINKSFDTIDQFWSIVLSRLDKKRPLWCFAHNIVFDLTILDAWYKGDNLGISVDLPVLDDPPVFLCCSHERGKVNFVDTFNFWKCSLADLGQQQGLEKLPMPISPKLSEQWQKYCRRDVEVLSCSVDNLIKWLASNDLGPLKYTIASIALSTYKHRFMPVNTIHVHDNDAVLALEREAYHGGLTHPYYIGKVRQKVYKLDVNSLYPAMMLKKYPVKIFHTTTSATPQGLLDHMTKWGAVARVRIRSDKNPYPLYKDKRLIEAVGDFVTTLCGQELLDALYADDITEISDVCYYEMADIFTRYVQYFWTKRKEYKDKGDAVGSQFCKLLLNSLYGKFGQRSFWWRDLDYNELERLYEAEGLPVPSLYEKEKAKPIFPFGVHYWTPKGFPDPLKVRYVNKCLQVYQSQGEHHESCPIIASYVTSYARSYIRLLRRIAGNNHCYYTDTDSLFCSKLGYDRLNRAGYVDSGVIGKLKLEEVYPSVTIYGPKDYVTSQGRVIKGIRKDAKPVCPKCQLASDNPKKCQHCGMAIKDPNTFEQLQFEGIKGIMRPKREPGPYILIARVQKTLQRQYKKGTVTKSGWTRYPVQSD